MAEPELRGRVHGPHATTSISVNSVGSIVIDDQIHPSDVHVTLDGRRVAEDGLSTLILLPEGWRGSRLRHFVTLLVLGWRGYIGRKR
jgi:hypothetical protein